MYKYVRIWKKSIIIVPLRNGSIANYMIQILKRNFLLHFGQRRYLLLYIFTTFKRLTLQETVISLKFNPINKAVFSCFKLSCPLVVVYNTYISTENSFRIRIQRMSLKEFNFAISGSDKPPLSSLLNQ